MHQRTPDTAPTATPADASDDTPPDCAGCHHPLHADSADATLVCWHCQDRTDTLLAELPTLFSRLNTAAALTPTARASRSDNATGGSPIHAPMPLRLDVITLSAAGGIPTRLQAIEDAWRLARGFTIRPNTDGTRIFASWRTNPAHATSTHTRFLRMNLSWACTTYGEIGQDLQEIRRLHTEATTALSPDPRPGRIQVGTCPTLLPDHTACGARLTASTTDQRIRCHTCGARWAGLAAWRELRQAQQTLTARQSTRQPAGAAA
jgi:DNA-directed RNA polymerase subunit RPC12/RpoP